MQGSPIFRSKVGQGIAMAVLLFDGVCQFALVAVGLDLKLSQARPAIQDSLPETCHRPSGLQGPLSELTV